MDRELRRLFEFLAMAGSLLRIALFLGPVIYLAPPASAQEVLFGCTGAGGVEADSSSLYAIDPATGAATLIGAMGIYGCGGLAFDPATRSLFAVGLAPDADTISLWRVDMRTGTATLIGPTGVEDFIDTLTARISDLSFRPSDGVLFAFLQPQPGLLVLDVDTGAATLVGESEIEGKNGNGIAFSAAGVLFHTDDVSLATLDTASGAVTVVAEHTFPEVRCEDIPRINGMDFDADGVLYGSLNCGTGPNPSPLYLVTINPADGVITEVGATMDGLDGIAFGRIVPGDANCDGRIGAADLPALIALIGGEDYPACGADANEDGTVDSGDIASLVDRIFQPQG